MRESMLAIAAAGSIFALTASGATGLSDANPQASVPVQNSGSLRHHRPSLQRHLHRDVQRHTSAQITQAVTNDTSGTPSSACLCVPVALSIDGGATTL